MIDFIVEKILLPFLLLLLVAVIFSGPVIYTQYRQQEALLKDCFMQEHKTKECEYVLWKYENRTKTRSAIMPKTVVVR